MSAKIPVKLERAFFRIINNYPHYAFILLRKEIVFPSTVNTTAWTDYKRIGFNQDFINAENDDGVLFTVAHENLHLILQHDIRGMAMQKRYSNFNWEEWNICCDLEINPALLDEGFSLPISIKVCLDSQYKGMCAEQIYRMRQKDREENKPDNQPKPMGDVKPPEKEESSNSDKSEDNSDDSDDGENSSDSEDNDESDDDGDSNDKGESDENDDSSEDDNNSDSGDESDDGGKDSNSGNQSSISDSDIDDMITERAIETHRAIKAAKTRGKLPGYLEEMIKTIPPKTDVRDFLMRFLNDRCRNDYTFARPNKRYTQQGLILPTLYSQTFQRVILVADTSGSIGQDEIGKIGGIVKDCLEFYSENGTPPELQVIYCDTQVQRVDIVDEEYKWDNVPKGGGTDFSHPFQYIENEEIDCAALIYLTDGWGMVNHSINPEYPVLWALIAPNSWFKPHFGEIMVM